MKHIIYTILILMMHSMSLSFAADVQITATIDRTIIPLEETFTYMLEITGEKANSISNDPQLPDISDFAMYMGSSGTSQNIQIINGRMSVSKSMSFTFVASKLGQFQIPPAELEYKGAIYKSNYIDIEVVQQTSQPQPKSRSRRDVLPDNSNQTANQDNLFLRTFVNKKQVYINEPVILTYKIYTAVTVTSYGVAKAPNTTGFWTEEFPLGNQPQTQRETYKGREFLAAEIKKMALFPTEIGEKQITPMQIECDVRVQTRSRSIFDSFFDDPFFGRSVRQAVYSPAVTIDVLPLPEEGKPDNFSGLVGNFSITISADQSKVKTNEAIALKVKIAGAGNIKIIPEPDIDIPPDFERYDPKITESINREGDDISGSKTFEYVLIPRFAGIQKIKPIVFAYFDPISKRYQQKQTPELVIDVEKGSDEFVVSGSGLSKEEVRLLGKDIRFIQTHAPKFQKIGNYFYTSPYFIALSIFPLLLIGAAFSYRKRLDKLNDNVAYARSRKANQMAMNRLKKAKKALSEKTQKDFYSETSNALLGFLADKLNISAAGIITDQAEEMMKSRNIDEQVISQYLTCLHTCDYQRFAPSKATLDEMKEFYNQSKEAIIALEKMLASKRL